MHSQVSYFACELHLADLLLNIFMTGPLPFDLQTNHYQFELLFTEVNDLQDLLSYRLYATSILAVNCTQYQTTNSDLITNDWLAFSHCVHNQEMTCLPCEKQYSQK